MPNEMPDIKWIPSDPNIARLEQFLSDPANNRDLLQQDELIPGVKMVGQDKLYPQSPIIAQRLQTYLRGRGYDVSDNSEKATRNPNNPLTHWSEAKATSEVVREGVECSQCHTFTRGSMVPADMDRCPGCDNILLEKFPSKGLAYAKLREVDIETGEDDFFSTLESYTLLCQLETDEGKLEDIGLTFSREDVGSGWHATLPLMIDHYDRAAGLVYCYVDQSQVSEDDIKALQWNDSLARRGFRALADKVHGKRLIIPVENFDNYYTKKDFRPVKQVNGQLFDENAKLPIPERIKIYQPWLWEPRAVNSYTTWCHLVGMTPDIGWYSTDHPFPFSDDKLKQIESFLRIFTSIDPTRIRAALGSKRGAPDVIRVLSMLSGEPAIHNPNFVGATLEGMHYILSGQRPPREQLIQEMIYFKEVVGKDVTLSSFLSNLGVSTENLRYKKIDDGKTDLEYYQGIWDSLDLGDDDK